MQVDRRRYGGIGRGLGRAIAKKRAEFLDSIAADWGAEGSKRAGIEGKTASPMKPPTPER